MLTDGFLQAVPQEIQIVLSLAVLALLLFTIYGMFQDITPSYDDSKEVYPKDKKDKR